MPNDKITATCRALDELFKDFSGKEIRDTIVVWMAGSITTRSPSLADARKAIDDVTRPLLVLLEKEYKDRQQH